MLIICDFDGTVTEQDVTDLIWDTFYEGDWRSSVLDGYPEGRVSILDVIRRGYLGIRQSPEALLGHVAGRVTLRRGFTELVELAEKRSFSLRVLSCGLEFYIRALLPPGIPYDCFASSFDGTWDVRLPSGTSLAPGEDFKLHVLSKRRRGQDTTVYVGDGDNDFAAARSCDHVFAVRESRLAELCRETGTRAIEFESFHEVIAGVSRLARGPAF